MNLQFICFTKRALIPFNVFLRKYNWHFEYDIRNPQEKQKVNSWNLTSNFQMHIIQITPLSIHACTHRHVHSYICIYVIIFLSPHFFAYYTIKECKRESHVTILCLFVVCLLFYYYNVHFIVQIGLILLCSTGTP